MLHTELSGLAAIASKQHGAFTIAQAVGAGFSRRTVQRRCGTQWPRLYPGVMALPGAPRTVQQSVVGAWLACREPAAISGKAAALMWNLPVECPRPEVVVPAHRRLRGLEGVVVRRSRRWDRLDIVRLGVLRVTSLTRTLTDIASDLDDEELEAVLDAAHRDHPSVIRRLLRSLEHARGVPDAGRLRSLVVLRDPDRPIETPGETKLFRVLRWGRLPTPVPQLWLITRNGSRRVDFAYPSHRVALEYDEYAAHFSRRVSQDDRIKDHELAEIGWSVRRITEEMLDERPHDVVWTVSRALGLMAARWRPDEPAPGARRRRPVRREARPVR